MTPARALRLLPALLLACGLRPATAQVDVTVNLPPYELIYLSDFVSFEGDNTLDPLPTLDRLSVMLSGTGEVRFLLNSFLQFEGEDEQLVAALETVPFDVQQFPILTGVDLFDSPLEAESFYNQQVVDDLLEDLIEQGIPVAPTGFYRVEAVACAPNAPVRFSPVRGFSCEGGLLGEDARDTATTEVRYESVAEALTVLVAPANGAALSTPQPLFQWILPNPGRRDATDPSGFFRLWRRELDYLTVQEVLDTEPIFETPIQDETSLLYDGPSLESGYTYFWTFDTRVFTSSGEEFNPSPIFSFSIAEETAAPEYFESVLYRFGGNVPDVLDQLVGEGWRPNGVYLLDGRPVTPEELGALADQVRVIYGPAEAAATGPVN